MCEVGRFERCPSVLWIRSGWQTPTSHRASSARLGFRTTAAWARSRQLRLRGRWLESLNANDEPTAVLRWRPLIAAGDGASAKEVSKRQARSRVAVPEHPRRIQPTSRLDGRYLIDPATTQLRLQEVVDSGLSHVLRSVLGQASEYKAEVNWLARALITRLEVDWPMSPVAQSSSL